LEDLGGGATYLPVVGLCTLLVLCHRFCHRIPTTHTGLLHAGCSFPAVTFTATCVMPVEWLHWRSLLLPACAWFHCVDTVFATPAYHPSFLQFLVHVTGCDTLPPPLLALPIPAWFSLGLYGFPHILCLLIGTHHLPVCHCICHTCTCLDGTCLLRLPYMHCLPHTWVHTACFSCIYSALPWTPLHCHLRHLLLLLSAI